MSKLPIQRKNGKEKKKLAPRTSRKTKLPLQVLFEDRDFRGKGGGTGGRSISSWTIGSRPMCLGSESNNLLLTSSYCGKLFV